MATKSSYDALKRRVSSKRTGKASYEDLVGNAAKKRYSEDVKKVDSTYINSFLQDAGSFMSDSQKELEGMTWAGSMDSGARETRYGRTQDLGYRAKLISYYLENNKDQLDGDSYNQLSKALEEYQSGFTQVDEAFGNASKFFSQWDNEEDYKAWESKESFISAYLKNPEQATATMDYENAWVKEAKYRAETNRAMEAEDFQDFSRYTSTKQEGFWDKAFSQYSMGYGDLTYEYINNQGDIRNEISRKSSAYRADSKTDSGLEKYDYMTGEEVSVYNYYYAKEGKERAEEYLDYLSGILEQRANQETVQKVSETAKEHPFLSSALSVGTSLGSGFEYIGDVINYGADKLAGKDVDLGTNEAALITNTVRGTVSDMVDWEIRGWDAFDFLYTTAMSGADSLAAGLTFGNLGGAVLGLSAAAQGTNDALDRGMSNGQAFWNGLFSGVFEGLFETVSIGNFNKLKEVAPDSVKTIFKNLGKSMLVNASEEALTEIANIGYDTLINGEFANYTWEELKNGAWKDALAQVIEAGASGALMGVGMGTVGNTMGYVKGSSWAKNAYGEDPGALVSEALEIDPGNTFAQEMQGRLDSGKNISGGQMLQMHNQIVSSDVQAIQSAAAQRLTELGETGNVDAIAAALAKQAAGEELSKAEERAISKSKYGSRVANELNTENINSGTYASGWAEKIGTHRINAQEYSRMLKAAETAQEGAETAGSTDMAQVQNEAQQPQVDAATTEESSVAEDGVTRQVSTDQAITPHKIVSIDGGKVMIQTDNGTIAADDIQFGSKNADLLWRSAANFQGITPAGANGIIHAYRSGDSVTDYIKGAAQEFRNGYYNMESGGEDADKLTPAQREIIYRLGQKAAGESIARAQAVVSKKEKTTHSQGKVHFDRKGRTFDQKRETALKTMEQLSKVLGVEFHVYESYVNEAGRRVYRDANGNEKHAPNGWYDPSDGSIHIDLNAGADGKGTMLFTIAHELTHFIREWSPAKFKVLANFLVAQYGEKGVSVEELVQRQIAKAEGNGRTIDYDTAFEEVVADSMEAMLTDGNVQQVMADLKQQDKTIWQKICDWFKDLAADLKALVDAYKGVEPDSLEGRMVAQMQDVITILERLYADALVDASANFQAARAEKNTTQKGGEAKYQLREYSEHQRENWKSSKRIVVYENTQHLQKFIQESLSDKSFDKKMYFGAVQADLANLIQQNTGLDVDGYNVSLGSNEIRKIIKDHGDESREVPRGQRAVTVEDIANIPNVIQAPVNVVLSPNQYNGKPAIVFTGDSNGRMTVVAVVSDKRLDLFVQTAYVSAKKRNLATPTGEQAPINTPEANSGTVSTTNIAQGNGNVKEKSTEAMDIVMDDKTESFAPGLRFSERTWTESDYVQERENAAKEIAKAIGVSEKKAKAYIDSVNSIAKMIADDRVRLDYFSSPGRSSFVSNVEYGGSFDFSTLCKKRRLLTGTFTAIQKALPNTALTAEEILDIRNRMKEANLEVSCGLCYVEGSRGNMGQFAKEFLKLYKQYYPDAWQPNMADVNTPDGIEWVRINHPECYEQYEYFWNHFGTLKEGDKNLFASQQKPKLYQLHTEYKGEILEQFHNDDNVEEKNLNGGIRLQSFSDFEIVHLIDTMQIIMDMSRVGLAGQAYTKVPDFAWALGDTGLKINLSLIAKGVDENGMLIFDDVEGMPIDEAMKLRERYSKNVGTILVAFNDEQLLAAMADERVDFIIPFHRSQWKKSQYEAMGLPAKTKDYTYMQNEKFIKPQYHEYRGRMVKDRATNYMPNEYWDFSKTGKENAEGYLQMCARNNKRPKFYKLLQNNGDGSYSLKDDGSTDGYWKLLIDFKMYDNDGNGSPQSPVKPDFNMDEATRMLNDYSGGHSNFPVAQGIADNFVKEYKEKHKGQKFSDRASVDNASSVDDNNIIKTGEGENRVSTDSDGNRLSAEQSAFFAQSQARDGSGNLLVLYHGTANAGFTAFDPGKGRFGGSWFTTSRADADSYAGNYQHKLFDPDERDDVRSAVGGSYTLGSWMRFDSEADRAEFVKQYPEAESIKTDAEYAQLMKQADEAGNWDEFDWLEEEQERRRGELRRIQKAYGRYEWEHSREATLQELFDNPEQFTMSDVLRAWDAYDSNNAADENDATKEELIEALRIADRESVAQGDETIADIRFKARLPVGQEGEIVNRANNRTYAVYANATKPYEIDAKHRTLHEADLYPAIEAGLKDSSFDSVIVRNAKVGAHGETGDVVIIKEAGQVKLTSNKAPTEGENIHFSERDPELEKVNQVLEKENTQLKHDVAYLKELLKLQKQTTGGTKFTKSSVEAAAGQLMKYASAKGDKAELAGLLNGLYAYIAGSDEPTWDGVKEAAQPAVDWLQDHVNIKAERSAYAKDVLKEIQGSKVYLDEQQKKEVAYQYGSYNEFRKRAMGSVILTDNATMSLDSQWHEWAGEYPNLFDPDITSTDMPAALMDVFDSLRNMTETEYGYDRELFGQELLSQVYDSYWRVSTLRTVADRAQKQINKLKFEHAGRMATLKKYHTEQTTKLKDEHRQALQKVKQAERERFDQKLQETQERYQESRKKGVESRRKTEMRRKIRRTIMDLKKILNKGDKKRNVKEDMKDLVAQALRTADILFTDNYTEEGMIRNGVGTEMTEQEAKYMSEAQAILAEIDSAASAQERLEAENRLKGKLDYRIGKLRDVFTREKARLNKTKVSEVLGDLADAYASLENSEYDYVKGAFDENVYQYLTTLKSDVGGTIVKDMSLSQLEELHKAYTMVLTTVRNANKMFAANLKQTREQLGNQTIGEVKQASGEHGLWLPGEDKVNAFSWNNQKPVYAFERIGSPTLTQLFENTRAGEDRWAQDMTEAREFYLGQIQKHKYDGWDFDKQYKFTSTSGIDFSLNLEQIMSLYAYSKREQAHDHLLKGGFVFDGNTEVQVNKMGIKVTYLNKTAKAHNVSMESLAQIVSKLTAEQKAFVDEMQDYLSTTMGGKGNEVSMELYGVKLFNEKYYFPLRSAGQYMARAKEADLKKQQGQISIVNSGFTKATTPKSSNPVVLSGFMDVWADHVNEMSMYHSFVLPMEDFRRVYNYSSPNMETGQSVSVNSVIQDAYGEAATGYIDQLYRDLNGGAVSDPRETPAKALMGKFKKAAVFTSLSVVIQQPSAIGRAFAIIDPKYFIGGKVDSKRHKALWAELKQYAPVAAIKEMGYFDTGMGKSAKDFIKGKEYGTLKEKAAALFTDANYRDEVLSKAPALADELTWCVIWEAAKRENKAKNPKLDVKSEEFLQAAGKRFTEVITKTQVYDSVLSRSANMRSKGAFMSMWTAFMAEPTTTINMVEDALRKGKKGNKQYAARAMGAVMTSIVLNSLLSSLVYAMRDDDEDETFLEKYVQSFATEILDGINPITYYPFLKDVWSALQGFDIERSDMSLITSLVEKVTKLVQVLSKDTNSMDEAELEAHNKRLADAWWGVVDYVTALAGVPVKNVRRDINGAMNTYKTIAADLTDRDTSWGSLLDKVWSDVKNALPVVGWLPDKAAADKLYKATVSGDTAYQKRLESGYSSKTSLDNAIRKGLRANDSRIWEAALCWNNNDLEGYMRIAKQIKGEGHFSQDNIVAAIQAEAKAMIDSQSSGGSESKAKGYFTADKFAVAIGQGNGSMAATIKTDIIETAMANGKTEEEAEESFRSSAKSSMKEMFLEGGITKAQASKALVDHFGISEEDAKEDVQYWSFQKQYPAYDLSEAAVTKYYEYAEPAGIGADAYYEYYTKASACESDLDENGKAISGSKKAKIMDVIDAMKLTKAQKDALYYANGWAKSTINEAPWH